MHADNETNENAWPRLPPASGRAPPSTAVSVAGNVADNRKTFPVRVHEALIRGFHARFDSEPESAEVPAEDGTEYYLPWW